MDRERFDMRSESDTVDGLRRVTGRPMTHEETLAMRGAHAIDEVPEDVTPPGVS
jgi:hypothetical protein